jgi:hypothetical protein
MSPAIPMVQGFSTERTATAPSLESLPTVRLFVPLKYTGQSFLYRWHQEIFRQRILYCRFAPHMKLLAVQKCIHEQGVVCRFRWISVGSGWNDNLAAIHTLTVDPLITPP